LEGYIGSSITNATGSFTFSGDQPTSFDAGQNLSGGTVGFPYAASSAAVVSTVNVTARSTFRLGKTAMGHIRARHLEDHQKADARLRPALRLPDVPREQYGRVLNFSLDVEFYSRLPGAWFSKETARTAVTAISPRTTAALRRGSASRTRSIETVFRRRDWGIVYASTQDGNGAVNTLPVTSPTSAPSFGDPVMYLRNGIPIPRDKYKWPNFDPANFRKAPL